MTLDRLSTEYVPVQVSATIDGSSYDPTADKVQMAFMRGTAKPGSGDWNLARWETAGGTYLAECLVGPAGGIVLAPGLWSIWVQVTDSPEVPVRSPAQLSIT